MGPDDTPFADLFGGGKFWIGETIFDEVQQDVFERLWKNTNYGRSGSDFWNGSNDQTRVYRKGERGYEPPGDYLDCGYVMLEGVTITREQFDNMSTCEWQELQALTRHIPNLIVEEILEKRLLWMYTATPVITTLGMDDD